MIRKLYVERGEGGERGDGGEREREREETNGNTQVIRA